MKPPSLSPAQQACLRYYARNPDSPPPPQFGYLLLDSLVANGLLERAPAISIPPLPSAYRYRLTARGRWLVSSMSE